jgi:hypothetical protein
MLICPDAKSAQNDIASGSVPFDELRTQHRLRLNPQFELFVQR